MPRPEAPKIVIVNGDDWHGLYVNGKLYYEGHEIPTDIIFKALKVPYKAIDCDLPWLIKNGRFPADLKQVKKG
ncbi:MAG: hypothetical protein G01um10143_32 [Parcubacteria group bacterium Gr01-1014_3]|nr:MAG: hypothetical protein G01um10143_32 [Parcubacteria group bacterium Gr01-1014_3]